jgi:hypothetical protein
MREDEMKQEQGKLGALYARIGHEAPLMVGPDGYPVLRSDAQVEAHRVLSSYLEGLARGEGLIEASQELVAGWRGEPGDLLVAACARMVWAHEYALYQREWRIWSVGRVVEQLAARRAVCTSAAVGAALELLGEVLAFPVVGRWPLSGVVQLAARCVSARGLEREVVRGVSAALEGGLWRGELRSEARAELERVLEGVHEAHFELGSAWADMAHAELEELGEAARPGLRAAWDALLDHMPRPRTKAPSDRWWTRTRQRIEAVSEEGLRQRLRRWLPLVIRHGVGAARNEECLRGLVWASVAVADETVAALVGELAEVSWRRGEVKLGGVCTGALGLMAAELATGPLCRLKLRTRGAAQHAVERALAAQAARLGVSVEELEERGQPELGLDAQGVMRETLGDWVGEARVLEETLRVEVRWVRASRYGQVRLLFGQAEPEEDERGQKTAPRQVREQRSAELAAFEIAAHEIERALATQRERIEGLWLRPRRWALATHRARYLEHALVGQVARRMLWALEEDGEVCVALWRAGRWEGMSGERLEVGAGAQVGLWHPAMSAEAEVMGWRRRLSALGITQPVRQAHREVWREAGRGVWRDVDGRVRQLHLAALGKARGWQVEVLPRLGLTGRLGRLELGHVAVELWAQAVGREVEARGVPATVSCVRVCCVGADGEQMGLGVLEAGARSEVLRDVAFFVEVAGTRERMGA